MCSLMVPCYNSTWWKSSGGSESETTCKHVWIGPKCVAVKRVLKANGMWTYAWLSTLNSKYESSVWIMVTLWGSHFNPLPPPSRFLPPFLMAVLCSGSSQILLFRKETTKCMLKIACVVQSLLIFGQRHLLLDASARVIGEGVMSLWNCWYTGQKYLTPLFLAQMIVLGGLRWSWLDFSTTELSIVGGKHPGSGTHSEQHSHIKTQFAGGLRSLGRRVNILSSLLCSFHREKLSVGNSLYTSPPPVHVLAVALEKSYILQCVKDILSNCYALVFTWATRVKSLKGKCRFEW